MDVEREDHEVFDDYLELVIQYGSVAPSPAHPVHAYEVHKGRGAREKHRMCSKGRSDAHEHR